MGTNIYNGVGNDDNVVIVNELDNNAPLCLFLFVI